MHPFDGVGVHVGRRHFHRGRQIDDHRVVGRGLPDLGDRIAHLDRILEFGAGVRLRRIFETPIGVRIFVRPAGYFFGPVRGDAQNSRAILPEDHAALQCRGRVVQMQYRRMRSLDRFEGAGDQLGTCLRQDLDPDVVRDGVLLDDLADEVEVGLRGRRETDLDFLVAHGHQQIEHAPLAIRCHRVDQRLVAVPQIHRAPQRGLGDDLRWPGAVREVDRSERRVAGERHRAGALPVESRLARGNVAGGFTHAGSDGSAHGSQILCWRGPGRSAPGETKVRPASTTTRDGGASREIRLRRGS